MSCVYVAFCLLSSALAVPSKAAQTVVKDHTDKALTAPADSARAAKKKQKGKLLLDKEQNIGEVVVTGERRETSVNSVSNRISETIIDRSMGKSLASILEHVSGVSSIQTGTSVAKPVINGMYGNRILIVNNGARQTGQQWGLDHAPEIDQNSSGSIEVVKGAESVR